MTAASASSERPDTWQAAFDLIRTRGHERRDEPFRLASGQLSHDYIDGKYAVDTGERLAIVSRAVADLAAANGIEFDAVGGLTMGADPLAHGVAMVTGKAWFSVRKEQKTARTRAVDRGHPAAARHPGAARRRRHQHRWVHRDRARPDRSGRRRSSTGVIPMVDRGDVAARRFAKRGVPFHALVTYRDLGIDPVVDV